MIRKSIFGAASMIGLSGILAFSGCSSDSNNVSTDPTKASSRTTGGIALDLTLADGSEVTTVTYTITRNGAPIPNGTGMLAIGSDGKATGLITGLDAGAGYEITLDAPRTYDGGATTPCTGSATFSVVADSTTPVAVVLQCDDATSGTGNVTINGTFNVCPKVGVATASPATAAVGSTIALSVTASDKDNDELTYSWFTGETYSESAVFASGASATYTCAAAGTFTIDVSVYDGDDRGCRRDLRTALTVTCADSAPVDSGTDPVDSGTDPVDSGTDPVDSGTDPVDSGTDPVDSGTDPVDSGTDPVDSGTDPVDSGMGDEWPMGRSAACKTCQTTNCTAYNDENTVDNCADSACRAVVACELNSNCFTNMQENLLCYCGGAGTAGIDACFGSGFVPYGACKTIIEENLGPTTDVGLVLERFVDPLYPAGVANRLTTCIGELCATECLL